MGVGNFLPLALPRPRGAAPTGAGAGVPAAAAGADRPRDLPRAAIMYLKLAKHECGVSGVAHENTELTRKFQRKVDNVGG